MKNYIISLIILAAFYNVRSQNFNLDGIEKIYYYKTSADFFNNQKDSIVGDNIKYSYGKVSFVDKKSNKKVKYHLRKDLSIFAFKIYKEGFYHLPIFALNNGEKHYGVYMGGNENLFLVFYTNNNMNVKYDANNYAVFYAGSYDQFGYSLLFTKKGFESKKNGEIEYFIKDNEDLHKKYLNERASTTTFNWNKNYISKQLLYLREYNNLAK